MSFKNWIKNIFDFRHNIISYVIVFVLVIIYMLPQILISGYESGAPLWAFLFMIPVMLIGGGLEEAGWRYILQTEIEKKINFTVSTLIVALCWWLWHLPLFFIEGTSQHGMNYFAFGIGLLGLSFAHGSLRKNTNSVWLCMLLHSVLNSLHGIFVIKENISGNITGAVLLIVSAYVLNIINKKKKICE